MGVIESIRNRQTLLLTLIGLGVLSFLIPYDAVIALMGNTATSQAAGSVNGEEISFLEYRTKVQERNGLFNYTDNRAAQNEVWADIVSERLYGDEFEDLGLALTKEEFDDIRYGDFVSPWVSRTFYGGQVNEQKKDEWRQSFSNMFNNPEGRKSYEGYAGIITQKRTREKFDGLVKAGLAANTLEGKREFLRAEEKVDFRYVLKQYTSTPDTEVEVTDRDIRNYYAAHKDDAQYAQRAGRDIEYVRIQAPDSTVKCRHILLKTDDVNDPDQLAALEARADSIKLRLEAGDAFADLVNKHSEDPGSKATGGEYEFQRGRVVKPFEDFCFDNPVGSIGTAQTTYGLHLIEVLDQQWPTPEQMSSGEQTAKNMAINNSTTEELRAAADEEGYAIVEARDIQSSAQAITGLTNAGAIVAWAYGAEPGEVSQQFEVDGNYVIATLIRVKEAGVPPLENVEDEMRAGAIKDKKAEMYAGAHDRQLAGGHRRQGGCPGPKRCRCQPQDAEHQRRWRWNRTRRGRCGILPAPQRSQRSDPRGQWCLGDFPNRPQPGRGVRNVCFGGEHPERPDLLPEPAADQRCSGSFVLGHLGEGRRRRPAPGKLIRDPSRTGRLSACVGHSDRSRRQASP